MPQKAFQAELDAIILTYLADVSTVALEFHADQKNMSNCNRAVTHVTHWGEVLGKNMTVG